MRYNTPVPDDDFTKQLTAAAEHLSRADPLLVPVIRHAGLPTITPHRDYFRELVIAIISQQVSTKAAETIFQRLEASFGGTLPGASQLAAIPIEQLRGVGISGRKASYILDLAAHASDGRLRLDTLQNFDDAEVSRQLIAVKGIGQWTTDVFMIFCLGRPDILAVGDLGIRAGVRKLLSLEELPGPEQVAAIAAERGWTPYRSSACWYVWRLLDDNLGLYQTRP